MITTKDKSTFHDESIDLDKNSRTSTCQGFRHLLSIKCMPFLDLFLYYYNLYTHRTQKRYFLVKVTQKIIY